MPTGFRTSGRLADPDRPAPHDACPIERTLAVVGTRTAIVIMREAGYGTLRYDDFVRRTGLSEAMVATRLRELTDEGLLAKVPYQEPGSRARHEYVLTPAGEDLLPALVALVDWGSRHRPRSAGPRYQHEGCGSRVHVVLRCDAGHDLGPGDVVATA